MPWHAPCLALPREVPVGWWLAVILSTGEVPYDGVDQDGDGVDLVDVDGDGFASELAGGPDCDDRDPSVHPRARDLAGDGRDADCDGRDGSRLATLRARPSGGRRARRGPSPRS
jgi:hypothetical protein